MLSSCVCPLLTGSTAAPHPQQARGTAAWLLWRIWCSHYGKSRPSSLWRRRLSCPTRQSWTPQCWVGSRVLSGASLPGLCTSSPKSSSYTCWGERRRNVRYILDTQKRNPQLWELFKEFLHPADKTWTFSLLLLVASSRANCFYPSISKLGK